ncbi:MAG: DUF2809 domain-containing protein [Spirosomataceae bacterium]
MAFHQRYLILAAGLLGTETAIALWVHDAFLRPIGGDFLVVILLYTTVRGLTRFRPYPVLLGVLLFSYLIEALQYVHYVDLLGWGHLKAARIVLGTGFSWVDMLAYTVGALFVFIVEKRFNPTLSQ